MDVSCAIPGGLTSDGTGLRVTPTYCIDPRLGRPRELVVKQAREHPNRIAYHAPAIARAVAMALERPKHVICGLSALAVYGLRFFADQCDTTLEGPVRRKVAASASTPHVSHRTEVEPWTVHFYGIPLAVSPPADALVTAIRQIRSGLHSWAVIDVPGLTPVEIRCIQVLDMTRRHLGLRLEDLFLAAHGKLNRRWLARLCGLSSKFADSPKETEMRLLCTHACDTLELVEQFALIDGSRTITRFDLALPDLKIALMYDGEHHLDRQQRDTDSRINIECAVRGWLVIRVTAKTLPLLPRYLEEAVASRRRGIA